MSLAKQKNGKDLVNYSGPQVIQGMTLSALLESLARNRFQVDVQCYPRLARLVIMGAMNQVWAMCENLIKGRYIKSAQIHEPPVFILGHWRSGTTHLHNLLSLDENFAAPTAYSACFPNHFVFTQSASSIFNLLAPKTRPMDNVAFASFTPHEDEFATAAMSTVSPYMKALFPLTENGDKASLDPDKLDLESLEKWKSALVTFLKKVSLTSNGRLVIKSPTHTSRIRIILEMFPSSKFIYLYRNPYDVFSSTRILWEKAFCPSALQMMSRERMDKIILDWGAELLSLYYRDKSLIPDGDLHEIRFEDLEADPMAELNTLYKELDLHGFNEFSPRARHYLKNLANYRKNEHSLDPGSVRLVNEYWADSFKLHGYEMKSDV